MKLLSARLVVSLVLSIGISVTTAETAAWQETTWRGERSFRAVAGDWAAIVSAERARLVYLGRGDGQRNLLFETADRSDPVGWGGHRVWLGPQATWSSGGWPPPTAWEKAPAERVMAREERIELVLPDAGDGWPRMIRAYFWADGKLHCVVRTEGGTRAAQVIQILQVATSAVVTARALPAPTVPRGYVLVHLGRQPSPRYVFPEPPQVARHAEGIELHYNATTEKIGLLPQALDAHFAEGGLRVTRGRESGAAEATPDDGFVTQVYVGSPSTPLIELEQLSPAWKPGGDAEFEMIVEPRAG